MKNATKTIKKYKVVVEFIIPDHIELGAFSVVVDTEEDALKFKNRLATDEYLGMYPVPSVE